MPTKAQLEEKMLKMKEEINKLSEYNTQLELSNKKLRSEPKLKSNPQFIKALEVKDNDIKILNEDLQAQAITIQELIGVSSDLRDKISALKKRNYELFSSNTLLDKKLTQAYESLHKLISKL